MGSSLAVRAPGSPSRPSGCPTDDQLLAFIPGQLAPAEASSVTAHLETCTACQSRLTTLRQRSRQAQTEPTTPPKPLGLSPAAPPRGSDTPTTFVAQARLRMPQRIGQYQLLKQIGRGGMGLVYLARHLKLGRTVALKLLPGLHLSEKSAIVRLQREIAATGRLQHPNIVFATDANEEDGIDYLVMEHIEGIDVGRLVTALGPLPCPAACEIIRQAALGLAHIHSCGLVHRDLKPSNLMLASDGVVKILDLGLALLREGLATSEDSATQTGYLLGTADYVSPEQLHDPHDADVRSDLYSIGCTFYKLLIGRAPFSGSDHSSLAKKLDAHRYTSPPAICELRPDVPPEVDAVLGRLLAKEPADRLQEPAELAELLAPLAAGADLVALYRQLGPQADLDELPLPEPLATPLQPDASTHSQGKTPTPTAQLLPKPRPAWPMALAGTLVVTLLAVGIWWSINRGLRDTPGGSTSTTVPKTSTPPTAATPFPGLGPLPTEIELPDASGHSLDIDEPRKEIRAGADSIQLIRLGELQPGNGTISLDLEFVRDKGEAGLFFGYKNDSLVPGQFWGFGDFVYLAILPQPKYDKFFAFRHDTAQVRPGNRALWADVEAVQVYLPQMKGDRIFRIEIDYTPAGLSAIRANGKDYSRLLKTSYGKSFKPESVFGTWGLYNNGSNIRVLQPTLREHHDKATSQRGDG